MNTETPRVFLVTSEEYEVKHSPAYAILKSKKEKKNRIARLVLPRGNESAVRRKHSDGRLRRPRAEHAAADRVSVCLSLDFNWTLWYITYSMMQSPS